MPSVIFLRVLVLQPSELTWYYWQKVLETYANSLRKIYKWVVYNYVATLRDQAIWGLGGVLIDANKST